MKKPCEGAALYEGGVVAPPFTVGIYSQILCLHTVLSMWLYKSVRSLYKEH